MVLIIVVYLYSHIDGGTDVLNTNTMTITKLEGDNRPHIIDTFSVVVDLKEDDQQHIDDEYIKFYFEGEYPNKVVCVMYLSNSPADEEWYEVTIMITDKDEDERVSKLSVVEQFLENLNN